MTLIEIPLALFFLIALADVVHAIMDWRQGWVAGSISVCCVVLIAILLSIASVDAVQARYRGKRHHGKPATDKVGEAHGIE